MRKDGDSGPISLSLKNVYPREIGNLAYFFY